MKMRNAFIVFVLVGLLACHYHDTSIPNGPHADFSAIKGNTITTGDPSFQVLVRSISDSRCPSDAVCIWAGEGKVTFQIGPNEFSLKIGASKSFSVGQKNYELTLTGVTPYPSSLNANEEKKAIFTLKQL
ncbi:MAG TPA: hypothetical protein VL728_17750 [Cyclobacteriaceae bacterium]|nr:hypothetical protein [Cyclobacteriaceae bacterium]